MTKLSPKQFRIALTGAVLLYVLAMAGAGAWLYLNREITAQKRSMQTPNVTTWLPGHEPKLPGSWEEKKPEAAKAPEEKPADAPPAAMPPAEPAAALPENTQANTPENTSVENNTPATTTQLAEQQVTPPAAEAPVATAPAAMTKWQKYARAFDHNDKHPRIILIVTDLGLSAAVTEAAIKELPPEATLTFNAASSQLEASIAAARTAGHEVVLAVPMEPDNYPQNDPGPDALLTSLSDQDNVTRLRRMMARSDGYVAVTPYMGQKFVTEEAKLTPVLDVVKQEGLMAVDSTVNKDSLIAPLSRLGKLPFARGDLRIDAAMSAQTLDQQLEALEKVARDNGSAVAMVLPYPEAIMKIKAWAATLAQKGLILAPLTAMAGGEMPVAPAANPQ